MGRHPTGNIPKQPLRIIMSKHREIMRRLVAGESQHHIAMQMGLNESRLSVICNSPFFKRELQKLENEVNGRYVETTADVQARINELQPAAIDVLEKIIKEKEVDGRAVSLPLKKDTALDILELAGSGKRKNLTVADAMGDVVKIISDGFKLAKELKDAQMQSKGNGTNGNGHNGTNGNGNGDGNSTHLEIDITPLPAVTPRIEARSIVTPDGTEYITAEDTPPT